MFSSDEKKYILTLARQAIEYYLDTGEKMTFDGRGERPFAPTLAEHRACFVTLTKDFELRGCIGSLEAHQPLYQDIIDNAIAAATQDDRFFPVTKNELPEISIEVSVLTKPVMLSGGVGARHALPQQLRQGGETPPLQLRQGGETPPLQPIEILDALTIGVDGVIVKRGNKSATYLPQVWDEILDKHDFLSSLCLKAGLEPNDWQKAGTEIETYRVEIVSEAITYNA